MAGKQHGYETPLGLAKQLRSAPCQPALPCAGALVCPALCQSVPACASLLGVGGGKQGG